MAPKVGSAVTYQDATGKPRAALVLHVYPHSEATELPDPLMVNVAFVDDSDLPMGPNGRFIQLGLSVPHRDAAASGVPCWFGGVEQ